jgi:hypothetical protein
MTAIDRLSPEEFFDHDPAHLHPDLQPWVVKKPFVGVMVQHPLVNQLLYSAPQINEIYAKKKQLYDEYVARGDYASSIFVCIERPFRLEMLEYWRRHGRITTEEWLRRLPEVWADAEPDDTRSAHLVMWRQAKAANGGKIVMDSDDHRPPAWFKRKRVRVHRGTAHREDKLGIAWSTDRSIARFFAQRANLTDDAPGWIVTGWAPVDQVLGWLTTRGESEVVIDPKAVTDVSWERSV